jgi:hypothetical protein
MPRCTVGDLCIVIRSDCGNEGREVEIVRWVERDWPMPEIYYRATARGPGWLFRARYPLVGLPAFVNPLFWALRDDWLLPLRPAAEPRADAERDDCVLEIPLG